MRSTQPIGQRIGQSIGLLAAAPLLLVACAMPEREGPPAPVVESGRSPVAETTPEPKPAPQPAPQPAKPRPTSVYAYTPPEAVPEPEPEPQPAAPETSSQQPAQASAQEAAAPSQQPKPAQASPRAKPAAEAASPPATAQKSPPSEPARPPEPAPAQQTAAQPAPPAQAPAPPAPEVASAPALSSLAPAGMQPAVESLALRAEQQRQTGDYSGAAATLERALRIEPQQAFLWNRLARVRLEQGLGAQAGNLAARSNALAGDQPALKQNNWDVIATVRRQSGDVQGAVEAERMASGG
jgi:hypothetical protein